MDSIRILYWPNISVSKNIKSDSAFNLMHQIIKYINKNRYWHFYVCLPEETDEEYVFEHFPALDCENVTILRVPMSKHRRLSGYEFNYDELRKAIKVWDIDLDLIINMLPEYTASLSQFFSRSLDRSLGPINVPIVSVFNWPHSWHTKHQQIIDTRVAFRQYEGHYFSEQTWTYSDVARDLIYEIGERFNAKHKEVHKMYYGLDLDEYQPYLNKDYGKFRDVDGKVRFLFNHRNNRYCGVDRLQEWVKRLSAIRQDFKLVLKNPAWLDELKRNKNMQKFVDDYADFVEINPNVNKYKEEFYADMARCDVAMCAHVYLPWNLSCQEAALMGLPIFGPQDTALDEILTPDYPFLFKNIRDMVTIASDLIDSILAGEEMPDTKSLVLRYDWNKIIPSWILEIEKIVGKYRFAEYGGAKRNSLPGILMKHGKPFTKKELRDKIKYTKPNGKVHTILPGMEESNWTRQRQVFLKAGYKDDCSKSEPTFYHPDW